MDLQNNERLTCNKNTSDCDNAQAIRQRNEEYEEVREKLKALYETLDDKELELLLSEIAAVIRERKE